MPTIRVDMLEGRTAEQKRALIRELTDGCIRALGAAPDSVSVLLYELPRTHWARGGVPMSEKPPAPPQLPPEGL